jgi:hypothetical protein
MMDVNAEIAARVDARHDPFHDRPIVRATNGIAGRAQEREGAAARKAPVVGPPPTRPNPAAFAASYLSL